MGLAVNAAVHDALLDQVLVWDAHCGMYPDPATDLAELARWHAAGVDHLSLNVGFDVLDWSATVATLASYRRQLQGMAALAVQVGSVDEVDAARAQGRLAVSFDIEGAAALNGELGMVGLYRDLGVRQMHLAYNLNSDAAGGCHDEDRGLTPFGRAVVAEMNRVGMLVDASHAGSRSAFELIEVSATPVVFSHSNARALCNHERNIDDALIRACAARGGVIAINGIGIFLGDNDASESRLADHVCHVAELVGPGHVALGLDHAPASGLAGRDLGAVVRARPDFWPPGRGYEQTTINMLGPEGLRGLCGLLGQRGWSATELEGLLGVNYRRVAAVGWAPVSAR